MALSHELSGEIAAALLAAKERSPGELKDLEQTILMIHSTLQRLADDARVARLKSHSATVKRIAAGR